ncbi:MAG: VCBS repeat-containing protein [Nitrospirae bacterium]|nr:VCBS repeat-containing protein [Candidatus Manganitrophaceae bacterium]
MQFSASVDGTLNKGVIWQITGPGSISPTTGLYRAPLNITGTTTIQAVSQEDPSRFGNAAVTTTAFSKLPGEVVPAGSTLMVIGGYSVPGGQVIDLNDDGVPDLITATPSGNLVTIFLGIGNGLFQKQAQVSINQPVAISVGDFLNTADFTADVAIAGRNESEIKLIRGQKGRAQDPFTSTAIPLPLSDPASNPLSGKIPSALTVGRFHGDVNTRNSDLVVGTEDGSVILFLQDRQSGNFTPQAPVALGGKLIQMVSADFNGDNLTDLAVLREGANDVLVLLGNGAGAFSAPLSVTFPSPPTSIAIGQFNQDQIADLAATHPSTSQISISLGKGDGTFQPTQFTPVESAPTSISSGDFNLNKQGKQADLAVSLPASNKVLLLFGDGAGNFIGNLGYNTDAPPIALVPGFFTSQATRGIQSIGFAYINGSQNRFYLLSNTTS